MTGSGGHGHTPHGVGDTSTTMPWNVALDQYATTQRAAGRAPGTIRLHRHYLSGVAAVVTSPWAATRLELLTYMGAGQWAAETRRSARSAVRGFYRWGHGMGYIDVDPALGLPAITVPPPLPRPTPEHLVAQLVKRNDRIGLMGQLGAYAGLRAAEIARVHSRDLVGDTLVVFGKGSKLRQVPIVHRGLLASLERLDGWAFPNGLGSHLSPGHVSRLVSAELPDGWTAHTLRHRMATVGYGATHDLLAVMTVLGHSRPETTQRYVQVPDDDVRLVVAAAS